MSDSPADGDDYLGLLTQVLNRTRMLLSAGCLGDAQSRQEIARLELEVAAAQLRSQAHRSSGSVILLPASGAVRRLTRPVVDESRRLRQTSAATRARSVKLRSLRHAAAI